MSNKPFQQSKEELDRQEKQTILVAKHLGDAVEWHDDEPYWNGMYSSVGEGNEWFAKFCPATDLNAIALIERSLTETQFNDYRIEVLRRVDGSTQYSIDRGMLCTSPQVKLDALARIIEYPSKWNSRG